jgi:hypothetical protein
MKEPVVRATVGHRSREEDDPRMIAVLLAMLVIVALAGTVVVYVAFPHRGEEVPRAPWVGEAMQKGVNALPTLDNQRERQHH